MFTISDLKRYDVDAYDCRIHVAEIGEGPLVLLVHGFPESWYSWRFQLPALAEAGYRVAAIDVRGYGSSEAPEEIEAYRLMDLAGDCVGVVEALGETTATIVGHDWGSPIASSAAQIRPDVFTAVALLSVPFSPRNRHKPTDIFRFIGGDEEFYIEYFQEPGRAEAEIALNPKRWLEGFYFSASGDSPPLKPGEKSMGFVAPGSFLGDRFLFPSEPLSWMTEEDLNFYAEEFHKAGFTGGLNRYRNVDRDWIDFRGWHGAPILQPSMFIGGEKDGPTILGASAIAGFKESLPQLHSSTILPDVGHWIQQEAAEEVNELLTDFLKSVSQRRLLLIETISVLGLVNGRG